MKATLISWMGTDLTVANAARVSFDKYHETLDESDIRLIRYLAKHNHWTPFAHCQAQFHVRAPIFVARQLVRHKIGMTPADQPMNEISRRYVDTKPAFFYPKAWRKRAENKKQGSEGPIKCRATTQRINEQYKEAVEYLTELYEDLLAQGVCPEQARIVLPLSMYTEWYWTGSLMAWARICNLRMSPDAQLETSLIAWQINEQMKGRFPVSWAALRNEVDKDEK